MTVSNLKQAPKSGDCGYFSGYVAYLKDRYGAGFSSQQVSNQDVYLARNTYWKRHNNKYSDHGLKPATGIQGLNDPSLMREFLQDIGLKGYTTFHANRTTKGASLHNEQQIRALLRRHSPTTQSKNTLLLAMSPLANGHWVAIVGQTGNTTTPKSSLNVNQLPQLKWPSRGEYVKLLQETLNRAPPSKLPKLKVDSIFGPKTYQRVREFQGNEYIGIDGVVGKDTWGELERHMAQNEHIVSSVQYWAYDPSASIPTLFYKSEAALLKVLAHNGVIACAAKTRP